MDLVPKDILLDILVQLELVDLHRISLTCKHIYMISQTPKLWDAKYLRDFSNILVFLPKPPPSPVKKERQLQLTDLNMLCGSLPINIIPRSTVIKIETPKQIPAFGLDSPSIAKYQNVYTLFAETTERMLTEGCPINPEFLRKDILSRRIREKLIEFVVNGMSNIHDFREVMIKLVFPIAIPDEYGWRAPSSSFGAVNRGIYSLKDRFYRDR